jgi:hypothetical protein
MTSSNSDQTTRSCQISSVFYFPKWKRESPL